MPFIFAPSVAPTAETAQGVASLVRLRGIRVGRIQLGAVDDPKRWSDDPVTMMAIITNWTLIERVLAQVEPSLSDDVYVWTSGDAQDELSLEGVAVQATCQNPIDANSRHGFSKVLDFYRLNRLSNRDTPIIIQIGDVTIRSRLLMVRFTGQPNTNLVTFSLTFIGAPPTRRKPQ